MELRQITVKSGGDTTHTHIGNCAFCRIAQVDEVEVVYFDQANLPSARLAHHTTCMGNDFLRLTFLRVRSSASKHQQPGNHVLAGSRGRANGNA